MVAPVADRRHRGVCIVPQLLYIISQFWLVRRIQCTVAFNLANEPNTHLHVCPAIGVVTTGWPCSCAHKDAIDCATGEPSFGVAAAAAVTVVVAIASDVFLFWLSCVSLPALLCASPNESFRGSEDSLFALSALVACRLSELFSRLRFAASSRSSFDGCREIWCGRGDGTARVPLGAAATETVILI